MARTVLLLVALALCSSAVCSSVASADDGGDANALAIEKGAAGKAAYDAGRYAEALAQFEEADALYHSPVLVLFAARSERRLGHLAQARRRYQQVAEEKLPEGAPESWRVAKADAARELAELTELQPAPVPTPESPPPESVDLTIPAAVFTVAGGAALVAGFVVGGFALSAAAAARDQLPASCNDNLMCPSFEQPGIDHAFQNAQTLGQVCDGLWISGAVVLAVGIVLFVIDPLDEPSRGLAIRF